MKTAKALQILVEESGVSKHAHTHEQIDGGLELEQNVNIQPLVGESHFPDDVVVSLPKIVGDIAGIVLFKGIEVELIHPTFAHKAGQ